MTTAAPSRYEGDLLAKCARCGYARINVRHERDPENAPEGAAYYADMLAELHDFEPVAAKDREPLLVTEDDLHWALEQTHRRFPHLGLLDGIESRWLAYSLIARFRERA